jgi:hypothetical protein
MKRMPILALSGMDASAGLHPEYPRSGGPRQWMSLARKGRVAVTAINHVFEPAAGGHSRIYVGR